MGLEKLMFQAIERVGLDVSLQPYHIILVIAA